MRAGRRPGSVARRDHQPHRAEQRRRGTARVGVRARGPRRRRHRLVQGWEDRVAARLPSSRGALRGRRVGVPRPGEPPGRRSAGAGASVGLASDRDAGLAAAGVPRPSHPAAHTAPGIRPAVLPRVPGGSRVSHVVDTHRYVDLPPERLGIGSFDGGSTTLERLFLVTSTDQPGTSVRQADPVEVADRMVGSLAFERLPLLSSYRHGSATPSRR